MRLARGVFFAVGVTMALVPLHAQQTSFDVCNVVLSDIKDHYSYYSSKEIFDEYKSQLRRVDSSSYSQFKSSVQTIGLSLPVAEDLLDLKGSDTEKSATLQSKYSDFMNSTYEQYKRKDVLSIQKDSASRDLAEAWNKCYQIVSNTLLGQNGTFIDAKPMGGFGRFLVTVHTQTPHAGDKVNVKAIEPTRYVKCYHDDALVTSATVLDSTTFDLTCEKEASFATPFSVETSAGKSQVVNLPSASSAMDDLVSSVQSLRVELANMVTKLTAAEEQHSRDVQAMQTAIQNLKIGKTATNVVRMGPGGIWDATHAPSFELQNAGEGRCPTDAPFLIGFKKDANATFSFLCGKIDLDK